MLTKQVPCIENRHVASVLNLLEGGGVVHENSNYCGLGRGAEWLDKTCTLTTVSLLIQLIAFQLFTYSQKMSKVHNKHSLQLLVKSSVI